MNVLLNHARDSMASLMGAQSVMWICFSLGMLSMALLVWSAKPGRHAIAVAIGFLSVLAVEIALALLDSSPVLSRWRQYISIIAAPVVIWRFGRECWIGYLSPWLFSWGRIGLLVLALFAVGYLMIKAVPTEEKEVFWALYSFTLLLAPIVLLKALIWWALHTLKAAYMGTYRNSKKSNRTVDVYFTTWWNDVVRGRTMDQGQWLAITTEHPEFIKSRWWQNKGAALWPDVLEWNTKRTQYSQYYLYVMSD